MLSWITVFGCFKAVDYKPIRAGSFHLNSSTWYCACLRNWLLWWGSCRVAVVLAPGSGVDKGLLHPRPSHLIFWLFYAVSSCCYHLTPVLQDSRGECGSLAAGLRRWWVKISGWWETCSLLLTWLSPGQQDLVRDRWSSLVNIGAEFPLLCIGPFPFYFGENLPSPQGIFICLRKLVFF